MFFEGQASAIGVAALLIAIPLAICIIIERVSPKTSYSMRDRFPGVIFMLLPPMLAVLAIPPLQALWDSIGVWPLFSIEGLGPVGVFLAILFARDFFNYVQHRLDHLLLWPIHAVHHSETELHAANGYAHPLQQLSQFAFITIPLSLVSFGDLLWPLAASLTVAFQSMVIHSPLRVHMGPLRYLLVDSRFHRIHHSLEPRHFDRNYGTVFSIWDQLFGTAYFPAEDEWPDTGVEGLPPPRTMWDYLTHPLRHLPRYRDVGLSQSLDVKPQSD